jgi:hypothetical protein
MEYSWVFNKYLEIKNDLVNNFKEVFNRQKYYSRKYRGNKYCDINVAIEDVTPNKTKLIQIFVRRDGFWVRDRIEFNSERLISHDITHNFYD